jgi:Fe-S cluster assembly iron-binding protein IscA
MLQITKDAALFIREAREQAGVSPDAALRIDLGSRDNGTGLRVGFVDVIPDGDQVAETEGLAVALAAPVADSLEDKVLDTRSTDAGVGLVLRAA